MKLSVFLIPVYGTLCLLLTTSLRAQQQDSSAQAHSQDSIQFQLRPRDRPDMDFGTVIPATFAPAVYSIDSSANAVILFDQGEVSFEPSYAGSHVFSYILERHTRIRLLNKNAFNLANFTLSTLR